MSTDKKLLNRTEVAKFLGIGTTTLYRMIEDGRFDVKPVPGTTLYSMDKITAWLNR